MPRRTEYQPIAATTLPLYLQQLSAETHTLQQHTEVYMQEILFQAYYKTVKKA